MPVAEADRACADAVDLARTAAEARAGVIGVGAHLGVSADDVRVATHLFECTHPGYPGWTWQVTVARASRAKAVTISEATLLPGPGSLLARYARGGTSDQARLASTVVAGLTRQQHGGPHLAAGHDHRLPGGTRLGPGHRLGTPDAQVLVSLLAR